MLLSSFLQISSKLSNERSEAASAHRAGITLPTLALLLNGVNGEWTYRLTPLAFGLYLGFSPASCTSFVNVWIWARSILLYSSGVLASTT